MSCTLYFCRKQGPTHWYAFKSTFSLLAQSSSSWDIMVKWLTQVDRKQYERKDFSFLCFTYMKEDLMAGGFTWSAYLIWVLEPNMCQEPSTVDLVLVFFSSTAYRKPTLKYPGWSWKLTVSESGLFHSAAKGSYHICSIRLHCQLIASEGFQCPKQNLLCRAGIYKDESPEWVVV